MTTKITNKKSESINFAKSPKQLSKLSKKTDKIRKKLEIQTSPPLNENKRAFDCAFPSSPDASSENQRIAQINFPRSPKKMESFPSVFEDKPTLLFATPTYLGNLFAGQDAVAKTETYIQNTPFSDFFSLEFPTTGSIIPHQTPVKKAPVKRIRMEAISVFQTLHEALSTNTFKYKVTCLAEGSNRSYFNVYTLEDNADPIISGVNNSDLVLKAFHGKNNSGFGETLLSAYLRNVIENYYALKRAGLPVAEIYNADTALQDGYIIQQKVSGRIDPLNDQHMLQVQNFFEISLRDNLVMDLLPQNFALENGQVILFDFVEEPDDGIRIFHQHAIEKWLKLYRTVCLKQDKAAAFLNKLTANHYQDFVRKQLELVYWD